MAKHNYSKHIIKLNSEQIETLIHEAVGFVPFYAPERAQLLKVLFEDFFIPCADIHPQQDKLETIPELSIISQDTELLNYFSQFNSVITKITSHGRTFLTLANPTAVDAILKMEPVPETLTFGDSFIVPEDLCDEGCFAILNVLFEEYLWGHGKRGDKTEGVASVLRAYIHCQNMWNALPKSIQPFYAYIDPLNARQIFTMVGYPEAFIEEIEKTLSEYRDTEDRHEGDFEE